MTWDDVCKRASVGGRQREMVEQFHRDLCPECGLDVDKCECEEADDE